jgi:hypothetical protein
MPQKDKLEFTLDIWEGGEFLDTITLNKKEASLYIFERRFYLIWYDGTEIDRVEEVTKTTALALFPKITVLPFLKDIE